MSFDRCYCFGANAARVFVATASFVLSAPVLAPAQEATTPTAAPQADAPNTAKPNYERLAESAVAEKLQLTDEQRAKIGELLKKRAAALAAAEGDAAAKIAADNDAEIAAQLNDEQKAALAAIIDWECPPG